MKKINKMITAFVLLLVLAMPMLSGCNLFGGSKKTYSVILRTNSSNYGSVVGTGTYEENEKVSLVAVAKNGYVFVNWSDGETDAIREFYIDKDYDLTAYFRSATPSTNFRFKKASIALAGCSIANDYIRLEAFQIKMNNKTIAGEDSSLQELPYNNAWRDFYATGNYTFNTGDSLVLKPDIFIRVVKNDSIVDTISFYEDINITVQNVQNHNGLLYDEVILSDNKLNNSNTSAYFTINLRLYFE